MVFWDYESGILRYLATVFLKVANAHREPVVTIILELGGSFSYWQKKSKRRRTASRKMIKIIKWGIKKRFLRAGKRVRESSRKDLKQEKIQSFIEKVFQQSYERMMVKVT